MVRYFSDEVLISCLALAFGLYQKDKVIGNEKVKLVCRIYLREKWIDLH